MSTGMQPTNAENLRTKTGLIAVVTGVVAVVALAIVTVSFLGSGNKDSIVAITTSAFGIISATVSAYLGIKASANSAAAASEHAGEKQKEAAVAENEVRVKESKVDRLNDEIDEREKKGDLDPKIAKELRDASVAAEEEARRTDPPQGGGR
ncbi:MAG TPA: hypothetical protein VFJ65_06680 [Solirubrobacterales bacterium]|nr:hypothetical protein [Solirubrobacterales bacterium]